MVDLSHAVVTKDYAENLFGGIMVCGINFGYSAEDERLEQQAGAVPVQSKSFFSDALVNQTRFRDRVLKWLMSWELPLKTERGQAGAFEKSFFQTNWLNTATRSITSEGAINKNVLLDNAGSVLALIEERKPSVIIFLGADLIDVLNDIRIRERVTSILGERSGNAKVYRANLPNYRGTRFKLLAQRWGATQIIGLPHPQSRGLSDDYVAALRPPIHVLHQIFAKADPALQPTYSSEVLEMDMEEGEFFGSCDPLFQEAKAVFSMDESQPVSFLQKHFRLGYDRAVRLHEALKSNQKSQTAGRHAV